jgi:hypothetical protein
MLVVGEIFAAAIFAEAIVAGGLTGGAGLAADEASIWDSPA